MNLPAGTYNVSAKFDVNSFRVGQYLQDILHVKTDGRTDTRVDKQIGGRAERRTDGQTD